MTPAMWSALAQSKLEPLGDALGPLLYFGQCFACGSQFVSTRDLVAFTHGSSARFCERCHTKARLQHGE